MTLTEALLEATRETSPLYFFGPGAEDGLPPEVERVHCPPQTVLPIAAGAAAVQVGRSVVAIAGDGDVYGAQMGELIHLCRRNVNLTLLVADNGRITRRDTLVGAWEYPVRPQELALAAGATFVAQGWLGDKAHLTRLIADAVGHPGFSLINVFMKDSDFYAKQEVNLDGQTGYDRHDRGQAVHRALDAAAFYTGILYHNPDRAPAPAPVRGGPLTPDEWQAALAAT